MVKKQKDANALKVIAIFIAITCVGVSMFAHFGVIDTLSICAVVAAGCAYLESVVYKAAGIASGRVQPDSNENNADDRCDP